MTTSSSATSVCPEPGMFDRVFKAFRYRDFRLMWVGACTSSIGTWMQILAQSWLVYRLSNSSLYLGLDAFFGQIPIFLLSLFGGVFADRRSRRGLLLMSQFIQMGCAFTLTALVATGVVRVWHIWCLSFTVGIAQSFGGPAYLALVPTLVSKEDISNAIALNSIQFNVARVVGPMLGGLALNGLGASWCFALNGISFVAVIITLLMIRPQFIPAPSATSVLQSMKEGLRFIRAREGMQSLVALAFLLTLLSFPLITFLPVMAREVLHGNANTFTLLLCFSGLGSILGALTSAAMKQKEQAKRSVMAMGILGIFIAAFGASRNVIVSIAFVFAAGAALMIVFASNSSVVQLRVDDVMRGRVMSVYNVAFRGGMPFGSVVCGYLIKQTSAPVIMIGNGILVVAIAFYFLLFQRKLMKL
ncbi:MAG: MFS transporter [Acidobacteriaceae bacterium]|nr:MFS transporter [Acidobacteriaceae bacterium]